MATDVGKTGIDVVGDVAARGAHFYLFYERVYPGFQTLDPSFSGVLATRSVSLDLDTLSLAS